MQTLREIYETGAMTEETAKLFTDLLGKRCKRETKNLLIGRIAYGSHLKYKWFTERLYLENGFARYMAGQDYISEIAYIRKELKENI